MVWPFQFSLFIQTALALLCRRQAILAKNQAQQLYVYVLFTKVISDGILILPHHPNKKTISLLAASTIFYMYVVKSHGSFTIKSRCD